MTPINRRDDEIVHKYITGATLRSLEKDFGITHERVRQILERQGVKIRKQGRPKVLITQEIDR